MSASTNLFSRGISQFGTYVIFFGKTIKAVFKKPFEGHEFGVQLLKVGYNSLIVVCAIQFFVGIILALLVGTTIEDIIPGSSQFMGAAIPIVIYKEFGPVISALMIAGRCGSAFTAEIGTMRVTEQIDALVTLSANPIQYLFVPRFLACIIMFPIITIIADIVGIIGGIIFSIVVLENTLDMIFTMSADFVRLRFILEGLIKSASFGGAIAIICCVEGFFCDKGAEGVGKAATKAIVLSFVAVIIIDLIFTSLSYIFFGGLF